MTDAGVGAAFRDGDPDAVRAVYRRYGTLVFGVAFKALGDRSLAEEATQMTFVKAWQASAAFDPQRELGPWLATIARRVAIDLHRREARRPHGTLDEATSHHEALVVLPASIERSAEVWEVRRAVESLPDDERAVVRLQHLDGLSHAEVADRLGIPVGTVKSRSFRAHRRLAELLAPLRGEA